MEQKEVERDSEDKVTEEGGEMTSSSTDQEVSTAVESTGLVKAEENSSRDVSVDTGESANGEAVDEQDNTAEKPGEVETCPEEAVDIGRSDMSQKSPNKAMVVKVTNSESYTSIF